MKIEVRQPRHSKTVMPAKAEVSKTGQTRNFQVVIPAKAGIQSEADVSKSPAVYILASARHGTLYIGVTSDLIQRVWQHREHLAKGFTERYEVDRLVWHEMHETMESAILREKRLKKWNREWKIRLIEETNPQWRDLWLDIVAVR
ncbi:GIY-YIG nuclease family protein [Lysobacter capsici]